MQPIWASAPGKIILFGEHAVVYGRPAIAIPVTHVQATATLLPGDAGEGLVLELPDVGQRLKLSDPEASSPLAHVARLAASSLGLGSPDWLLAVRSTIPVASGLGSGAAAATAIVRALSQAAQKPLAPAEVSALVYESEKLFHGTPSGVDNTVIAFEQPVWFVRGQPPQPFSIARPFTVVIADTGIASPTSVTVGDVRRGWEAEPARYEALFDAVGRVVHAARSAIERGQVEALGRLMDENHRLLQAMSVSSPELDALCNAARSAGALGAKLSGGGRGGNMLALVNPRGAVDIQSALVEAGAVRTITTEVSAESFSVKTQGPQSSEFSEDSAVSAPLR